MVVKEKQGGKMKTMNEAVKIAQKYIKGDRNISQEEATEAIEIIRVRLSWMGIKEEKEGVGRDDTDS